MERHYSRLDRLIASVDEALRISTGGAPVPQRENPAGDMAPPELDEEQRRHVAGLMRVNHTGEVCAQALYAGQAATARDEATRLAMQSAADEEMYAVKRSGKGQARIRVVNRPSADDSSPAA